MPGRKRWRVKLAKMDEVSGADIPAAEGARAALMKRYDPKATNTPPIERLNKEMADVLTSEVDGHQHGVVVNAYNGKLSMWVTHAQGTDDENGHSHAIARNADGAFVLATVAGHTHTVDQTAMASAMIALAKRKDGDMANDGTEGGGSAKPDAELQSKHDRLEKVVALTGEERAHFDTLATDKQDAFLTKSADGRQAEIKEVQKANEDPVEYTTTDGVVLHKSAGPAVIAMAKKMDIVAGENANLKAEREQVRLEKRAVEELPNLPGTVEVRAEMLKAIDAIPDQAKREAAQASLKANNDAMAKALETRGVGGEPEPGSPEDGLDQMAKAHASEHQVSFEKAYAAVMVTPKGQDLLRARPAAQESLKDA